MTPEKEAQRIYDKNYREVNKERLKAKAANHYQANKKEVTAQVQAYQLANQDKIKKYRKDRYQAQKEEQIREMFNAR